MLRYSSGRQYRPHFDYVESVEKSAFGPLLYLNEEYGGDQTTFVNAGLSVRGKTGQMLRFRNMLPSGDRDPLTKHSGESVTCGTEFLATRCDPAAPLATLAIQPEFPRLTTRRPVLHLP